MRKKVFKYKLQTISFKKEKNYKKSYGNYSLKCLTQGLITPLNLENLRRRLSKQFKKVNTYNKSKIYIRCCVWKPYTMKPLLSRMGKGSGNIVSWLSWMKSGSIIIDLLTLLPISNVYLLVKKAIKFFPIRLILVHKKNFRLG